MGRAGGGSREGVAGYRATGGAGSFYCSTDLCRSVAGDLRAGASPRPEPRGRERVDVLDGRLAGDELAYHHAGDPGEQDAVPAVAGGIPEPRQPRLRADDREPVGGDGPEPGPG